MPEWLRRMITLPKNRNSLSDVLGADVAATLTGMARAALSQELGALFSSATGALDGLEASAVSAVFKALGPEVPASIKGALTAEIATAFDSSVAHGAVALQAGVEAAVLRVLKLQA